MYNRYNIAIALVFTAIAFYSCSINKPVHMDDEYERWVGDIEPDSLLDSPDFRPCFGNDSIYQYFNFSKGLKYKGEKSALIKFIKDRYVPVNSKKTGYVRIRFIVNCEGKTGRFRVFESDENGKMAVMDEKVVSQLLNITEQLDGWGHQPNLKNARDYYQYLIFKIVKGKIHEILP